MVWAHFLAVGPLKAGCLGGQVDCVAPGCVGLGLLPSAAELEPGRQQAPASPDPGLLPLGALACGSGLLPVLSERVCCLWLLVLLPTARSLRLSCVAE